MARDDITLGEIKNNDLNLKIKTFYVPDLALFYGDKQFSNAKRLKSNYIVITAREWLTDTKQELFETSLCSLIEYVWSKYNLKTIFCADGQKCDRR